MLKQKIIFLCQTYLFSQKQISKHGKNIWHVDFCFYNRVYILYMYCNSVILQTTSFETLDWQCISVLLFYGFWRAARVNKPIISGWRIIFMLPGFDGTRTVTYRLIIGWTKFNGFFKLKRKTPVIQLRNTRITL